MNIKKGDKVKVITGKDKGVVAEVLAVLPKLNKVVVEGVNVHKLHQKPSNENPDGGIVNKEAPIAISNVKLAEGKKEKKTAKKAATKKTTKKAVKGDKK